MADNTEIAVGFVDVFNPRKRLMNAVRRRLLGPWRFLFVLQVLASLLSCLVLVVGVYFVNPSDTAWRLGAAFSGSLAVLAVSRVVGRLGVRWIEHRLKRQGINLANEVSFSVTPDGLSIASEGISSIVAWKNIIEVWREKICWVLLLNTGVVVSVPLRFFDTDEDEWTFMTVLLDRIAPEVRARSHDVRAFDGPVSSVRA